jgi:Tol biopolymer transport system component
MKKNKLAFPVLYFFIWVLVSLFVLPESNAQYFGRNKPAYRKFDFKVYQSPNFEIYHYFENDSVVQALASSFEKWYIRHQIMFLDTFDARNPIIIYANHPDFQQTAAISGQISIGTQGVTEALKNRVVIPVLETNAQTDHVIGHELVHVFHFRALFEDDSLSLNSLRNLPLWLVEGMAEYFSIGSVDANTAMIMRDAIQRDEFPTLKEMSRSYQYNPYRYGHSFVAFFGRTWGDSLIVPLYSETAKFGYERALERVIGLSETTVSTLWKSALTNQYTPLMADSARHVAVGRNLISAANAGEMNISPSLSPDGRFITFFSERDLVSLDLFLANAETGRIIRKLSSSIRNQDIDGFNFFESVGTWSPDGERFVYVAVKKGRNQLMMVDVNRPRRTREIVVPGVPAINNPSWSPDGKHIVFNGIVEGETDLFLYDIESKKVTNLTNDRYSYIHSSWSPDGRYLAFSTDRPQEAQKDKVMNFNFNLGIMDMHDPEKSIKVLNIFPEAENLNPIFNPEQDGLYFLSNRDGYRNLYFVQLEDEQVLQLTDLYTGISGITHLSPALSVARQTGEVVYSHYQDKKFTIYKANPEDFERRPVDPMEVDFTPATMPPFERASKPLVDAKLSIEPETPIFPVDSFAETPFQSKFSLSYIGSSGVGMATNRFGTGVAGGVSMLFSDITGDNQMFAALAVNGEIYDFGGQVGYQNQKSRIRWGGMVSHIPYPYAFLNYRQEPITIGGEVVMAENLQIIQYRTFEDQIMAFAFYPLSTTRRFEASASLAWYYFRIDAYNNYYYMGFFAGQSRERLDAPPGFNLQRVGLSYVGDNSYFGIASPIRGQRYRFGAEQIFGTVNMTSVTADYRRYIFMKPFTFAFRGTHYGRYGQEADDQGIFYPLYLGYPGFVRGLDYNSLYKLQGSNLIGEDWSFESLLGSKVLLAGAEIRFPLTGPERLALISSGLLFTELTFFFDAGVAWRGGDDITFDPDQVRQPGKRYPYFSVGPSLRINVFGALILEPFYAFPFQTGGISKGVWGFNFLPGW